MPYLHYFLCTVEIITVVISESEEMLVYCQGQQAGPLVPDHGRGGRGGEMGRDFA